MAKSDKKLWIDMCAGSELKDTQGETLSVEGADISDLEHGRGRFNDNHGKGFFNSLGIVTEAKKIFKSDDCENERHKYYWEKIKAPFVYAKGYLHNEEDHPNARAAAAIIRNIHRNDVPLRMKASVEGGVLARGIKDPTRLARTKIHSVALTFTPANNATLVEPLNVDKSESNWEKDQKLIKSVMHLAETNIPSFRHIERHASAHTIYDNINKIQELAKSVGIEIEVKGACPEVIMKNAVYSKINSNINKINKLVKALGDVNAGAQKYTDLYKPKQAETSAFTQNKQERQIKAQDKYQQDIGKLKADSTTPVKPVDVSDASQNMQVKSAVDAKKANVFKQHASKVMRDPAHMDTVINSLKDRGVDQAKIDKIVSSIQGHVSKAEDEMEKGEIANAAKGLAIATMMATGAHNLGKDTKKEAVKQVKPKTEQSRTVSSTDKKPKDKNNDPEYRKQTRAKAKEAMKWYRKNVKQKLKKALVAGYGGAGNPMSLTNGGVVQRESVEGSKKSETSDGFSYVSCDNCGHEQVHMERQVKCRKCKKNFPLIKLKDKV
jgi:hypothetical protein